MCVFIGNFLVGTSEEVVLTWWGPDPVPTNHILQNPKVNSIVCQVEDEDTLITTVQCTGWMRLLLNETPNFVADIYSESGMYMHSLHACTQCVLTDITSVFVLPSLTPCIILGELTQLCMAEGIQCVSVHSTEGLASALVSRLGLKKMEKDNELVTEVGMGVMEETGRVDTEKGSVDSEVVDSGVVTVGRMEETGTEKGSGVVAEVGVGAMEEMGCVEKDSEVVSGVEETGRAETEKDSEVVSGMEETGRAETEKDSEVVSGMEETGRAETGVEQQHVSVETGVDEGSAQVGQQSGKKGRAKRYGSSKRGGKRISMRGKGDTQALLDEMSEACQPMKY
jgi:hypothetical protein